MNYNNIKLKKEERTGMTEIDQEDFFRIKEVKKLNKVKDMVYDTLKDYELARNEDDYLIHKIYLNYFGVNIDYATIKTLPSIASILRARRSIQKPSSGNGEFPPTDKKVLKARGMLEDVYKEFFKE